MNDKVDAAQRRLMSNFDFTHTDLDANRHGYMSKGQRFKLRWKSRLGVAIYTLIALLFGGLACYLFLSIWLTGSSNGQLVTVGLTCLAVYLTVIAFGSTLRAWQVRRDLRKGLVSSVIGQIVQAFVPGRSRLNGFATERILYCPPISLELPFGAVNAFQEGKVYRIYFAPYSKVVLSIDGISENESGGQVG